MNQIAKFSKQIWRPKDVVTEPVTPSWKVPDLRQLPRETPAELDAFSRNPIGKVLNDAVRTGRLDLPRSGKTPIVGDLLSNDAIRSQMASLSDTISQIPQGALQKASVESLSQMAPLNQLAHDRLAALPPETIGNVLKSGPPQQSTLFLQRMASEISGRPVSPGQPDIPQLEEIFHSVQTPQGDAKVLGRTLINDEWYHFGTTSGTSPLQQASTWIAPTRLMASPNPAAQKDLNAGRVLKDVQGLFQGPWAPYVKGAGLLTKPHTVDIRHSDQDGIKSVLATLDTITGTLKTIQSVTQGIQDGLELIGMLGSLGSLGSYMQIFNQMKLPGTPGELITALITGKGINPKKPPAPPTADQTGSGKNGVLVTKGGAAAKAMGDGLLAKAEAEKKKKEEAAKKKAEEEKKKKEEEAAKKKAEEEKKKAEEEKKKKEEAAKKKAEEEKKKPNEEEKKAEEDSKKPEAPTANPTPAPAPTPTPQPDTGDDCAVIHDWDENSKEYQLAKALAERRECDLVKYGNNMDLSGYDKAIINAHGSPGQVSIGGNVNDGAQLGQEIKEAGFNGSKVETVVCHSATDPPSGTSVTNNLSNELGPKVVVSGYDTDTTIDPDSGKVHHVYHVPILGPFSPGKAVGLAATPQTVTPPTPVPSPSTTPAPVPLPSPNE